jgi:hypothetical protein
MLQDPEAGFFYFDIYNRLNFMFMNPAYVNQRLTIQSSISTLQFCPWCGNGLMEDFWLQDSLREIVAKEFPQINPDHQYNLLDALPEEFQSDAWWQQRQLPLKICQRPATVIDYSAIFTDNNGCCAGMTDVMFSNDYTCPKKRCCSDKPIIYQASRRTFYFSSASSLTLNHRFFMRQKTVARMLLCQIFYCPWCGINLPTSLAAQWFKIATTQFGVSDIYNKAQLQAKLPTEFLTEEWWRKRGL